VFDEVPKIWISDPMAAATLRISESVRRRFPIVLTLESDATNLTFKILDPKQKEGYRLLSGASRTQTRGWHT